MAGNQTRSIKSIRFKKTIIANALLGILTPTVLFAQTTSDDNNGLSQKYFIPEGFQAALESGLTIPVFLKTKDSQTNLSDTSQNNKFAEATLILKDDKLYVQSLKTNLSTNNGKLSNESEEQLAQVQNISFDNQNKIVVNKDIVLSIDVEHFVLTMEVGQEAFGARLTQKTDTLPRSNVEGVTSVLNYDAGVFHVKDTGDKPDSTNSYLNYQSVTAYKENSVTIDGSLYDLTGGDGKSSALNEVMFKRDLDGKALKIGMANSWNFQSIGSMSALNAEKIYGISLTNQSRTNTQTSESSLTPIMAFLPEPGDVLVYRDGKLLTSQSFPVGNFEIDTSRYPAGVYDVEVQVVINGQTRSSTTQRINKMMGNDHLSADKVYWDVYAGYVKNNVVPSDKFVEELDKILNGQTSLEKEDTYIAGFSLGKQFKVLSGLNLTTSNYAIKNNFYNETSARLQVFDYGSIDWNLLLSGKGSYRNIVNASVNLPKGLGSIWIGREKSHFKDDISIDNSDSYHYGTSINLSAILPKVPNIGSININKSRDKYNNNHNLNASYQTSLYTSKFGSLSLQAGLQRTKNIGDDKANTNKYISLNMSIPLGKAVSAGLSSYNGDMNLNVTARKDFKNSMVRHAGLTISKNLRQGDSDNHQGVAATGYMGFDSKYLSGNLNIARANTGRLTGNLSARGSIGITGHGVVPSGKTDTSGIIIESNLENKTTAIARVNGTPYQLTGKRNFIPLPAFSTYKVELMNDKNSRETVSVGEGRQAQFTLYPGNVALHQPKIKHLLTVFGKLVDEQGQALPGVAVNNHIGKTVTDAKGGFALDVDSQNPVINFSEKDVKPNKEDSTNICEVAVDMKNQKGVMWIGDVSCFKLAKNDSKNKILSMNQHVQYGQNDNRYYRD